MQKLLFITTSSLATNPRLVKEFEFLKETFKCTVICFEHDDWSLEPSKKIQGRNAEVDFISVNRHKEFYTTLISKLYHKIAIFLNPLFHQNTKIAAFASNDKTPQLYFKVKKFYHKNKPDRVIAHNLGAFYPALQLAQKTGCKLQLDIEDYHPGEEIYYNKKHDVQNRILIMQNSFSNASAITYASEGIKIKCEAIFKVKSDTKTRVIINAFKSDDFLLLNSNNEGVHCVWFSQNISHKRGLEDVFEAAQELPNINFHLIGKPNLEFIEAMMPSENIHIHQPMPQEELHEFLAGMDIGLALEDKQSDGNRDICLTNKFLAYAQAGLYIFATDTFGQKHFLNQLGMNAGKIINASLRDAINNLDKRVLAIDARRDRWERAKAFSWEKQSEVLLEVMK